jgi:hypothetical protein
MRASVVANLQLPRPQPKTAAHGKSVPLRRVFQKEVQKAREFIDTVMGARSEDLVHDHQQEEEGVVVTAPAPPSYVVYIHVCAACILGYSLSFFLCLADGLNSSCPFFESSD